MLLGIPTRQVSVAGASPWASPRPKPGRPRNVGYIDSESIASGPSLRVTNRGLTQICLFIQNREFGSSAELSLEQSSTLCPWAKFGAFSLFALFCSGVCRYRRGFG